MIHRNIILIALSVLLLSGCKKQNIIPLFEVESVGDFTIRAGENPIETQYYVTRDLTSTLAAQLETRNLTIDDISVIKPQAFILTSLEPNVDLNFITFVTADIFIRDPQQNIEIAFQEVVPPNTRRDLVLFPSLLNVKEVLEKSTFGVQVGVRVRSFLNRSVQVRMDMVFQVQE